MRVADKATDFEVVVPGVDRIAQCRRRLRRTLKAEHALVPRLAREPVGFLGEIWTTTMVNASLINRLSQAVDLIEKLQTSILIAALDDNSAR